MAESTYLAPVTILRFRLERNEQRSDNPRSKCVDNIFFQLLLSPIYNSSEGSLNRIRIRFGLLQVRCGHFFQHPTVVRRG